MCITRHGSPNEELHIVADGVYARNINYLCAINLHREDAGGGIGNNAHLYAIPLAGVERLVGAELTVIVGDRLYTTARTAYTYGEVGHTRVRNV